MFTVFVTHAAQGCNASDERVTVATETLGAFGKGDIGHHAGVRYEHILKRVDQLSSDLQHRDLQGSDIVRGLPISDARAELHQPRLRFATLNNEQFETGIHFLKQRRHVCINGVRVILHELLQGLGGSHQRYCTVGDEEGRVDIAGDFVASGI